MKRYNYQFQRNDFINKFEEVTAKNNVFHHLMRTTHYSPQLFEYTQKTLLDSYLSFYKCLIHLNLCYIPQDLSQAKTVIIKQMKSLFFRLKTLPFDHSVCEPLILVDVIWKD